MIHIQVENIENFLKRIKTCEHQYTISSMQGGFVHVKFFISQNDLQGKSEEETDE